VSALRVAASACQYLQDEVARARNGIRASRRHYSSRYISAKAKMVPAAAAGAVDQSAQVT